MSATPWLRRVAEVARRHGLELEHGGKHPRLVEPVSGRRLTVSSSPRCADTALREVERDCRRLVAEGSKSPR